MEESILPVCRELGIAVTAYGVLSRGLLSGHWSPDRELDARDFRAHSPRFPGENLRHNLALVEALRVEADHLGASVAQVAIAWVMTRGDDVVPLVGARRRDRLHEALGAVDLALPPEALACPERAVPPGAAAGGRDADDQMAQLDSER